MTEEQKRTPGEWVLNDNYIKNTLSIIINALGAKDYATALKEAQHTYEQIRCASSTEPVTAPKASGREGVDEHLLDRVTFYTAGFTGNTATVWTTETQDKYKSGLGEIILRSQQSQPQQDAEIIELAKRMAAFIESGSDNAVAYGLGKYHDYGPEYESLELRFHPLITKLAKQYEALKDGEKE